MTRICHDQEGTLRLRPWQLAAWPCVLLIAGLGLITQAMATDNTPPPQVLLLKSAEMPRYDRVEAAFRERIATQCEKEPPCPGIVATIAGDHSDADIVLPTLVVAVGHKAAMTARSRYSDLPQLHVMVSRVEYLDRPRAPALSAIYLEQPPLRLLRFTRYLLPGHRRIGILLSPRSTWKAEIEDAENDENDFYLNIQELSSGRDAGRAIRTMKQRIDILLALPDPVIFNRNTLGTILLTSFRSHIPVVGFSDGMVKAGAVAAVFSSPRTIGEEAGMRALALLAGAPPALQYPRLFETAINRRVASAMHLDLPPDEEVAAWEDAP